MQMLNPKFILMLQLLNLLHRRLLVMLLVFLRRLDPSVDFLADEQDLAVLVI
jgi:hypothetical protein